MIAMNTSARAKTPARKWDVAALRAKMLQHLGKHADAYPSQLEQRFPHVLERITVLWGSRQMDDYFLSLLVSDRQNRQGFPADVAKEIFQVSVIHGALGLDREPVAGGWNDLNDVGIERSRQQ